MPLTLDTSMSPPENFVEDPPTPQAQLSPMKSPTMFAVEKPFSPRSTKFSFADADLGEQPCPSPAKPKPKKGSRSPLRPGSHHRPPPSMNSDPAARSFDAQETSLEERVTPQNFLEEVFDAERPSAAKAPADDGEALPSPTQPVPPSPEAPPPKVFQAPVVEMPLNPPAAAVLSATEGLECPPLTHSEHSDLPLERIGTGDTGKPKVDDEEDENNVVEVPWYTLPFCCANF